MEKKARLGRGLDALLSSAGGNGDASATATAEIPIDQIQQNPYQPRKAFDDDELSALGASIREHGILQPLVVRQVGERFQLIAGERRLRAAQTVGLPSVPVHVVDFNDQQVLEAALVENIHRADLNPIEKAQGFKDYLKRFDMTQEQLAGRLGLDRTTISNLINLLDLPLEVQESVRRLQISLGHAKVLKGLANSERQIAVCREIIARGLSVRATEGMLKDQESETSSSPSKKTLEKTSHVQALESELQQSLSTHVEIRLKGKDRGQIVLSFDTNDDFERLLEVLRKG